MSGCLLVASACQGHFLWSRGSSYDDGCAAMAAVREASVVVTDAMSVVDVAVSTAASQERRPTGAETMQDAQQQLPSAGARATVAMGRQPCHNTDREQNSSASSGDGGTSPIAKVSALRERIVGRIEARSVKMSRTSEGP